MRHGLLNPDYQYHPLFRKFLQSRAQNNFNQDEYKKLQNIAGMLLAEAGDVSFAVSLLAQAENWSALVELLLKQVKKQIEQGCNKKVIQWIEVLPVVAH